MSHKHKTHIRDPKFATRSLCGQPWTATIRGGRACSDTDPPAVIDNESKSVNPTTCGRCIERWRATLKR